MKCPSIPVTLAILAATACGDTNTTTAPAEGALFAAMAATTYNCAGQTQIPETECLALVALYNGTDGPNWTQHTDWLETLEPCGWYGVDCFGGSVLNLGLNTNQLNGSIPPEIGNLTNLTYLGLGDNQLSGSIPPELGNLSNLHGIHLFNNQLTGPIPPQLGNLTNLEGIQAIGNQLSGPIPPELGNMTQLKRLNLAYNQLSGSIPPVLGNLSNLEDLGIQANQLTGPIPVELGNLANLFNLQLYSNQLSGPIPTELGNLTELQILLLGDNQLWGAIPTELGNLIKLVHLELHDNELTGPIPGSFGNLTLLETLWLADNRLGGLVPLEVAMLGGSPPTSGHCAFVSGNAGLYMPDIKPYRDADLDNDGYICGLGFSSILPVAIDIKPGSDPNSISLGSKGTVPVAIFSTPDFDATLVDPESITLADADVQLKGNGTPMASEQDVNQDGLMDLVVHVSTSGLALTEGDVEAVLEGDTFGGAHIRGSDSVRIVP